jgi:hypothetical protein
MNEVMRIVKDDNLVIISQNFDNDCSIQVSIRKTQVNQTLVKLNKHNDVVVKYDYTL